MTPGQEGLIVCAMTTFPSLRITRDALTPEGSFAEAQAAFLQPDQARVEKLNALLREKKIGVVAHFYMDPELQGVLSSCEWPHIGVSDSLKMADTGIEMVKAGCESIVVLGVDFMSENARAMLDDAGFGDTPVYRVAVDPIGCSLAESAEAKAYGAFLTEATEQDRALHVVYINTSLITKAKAHSLVPTITCTSSNVLKTILQADSQVDDLNVYFGPDTYMGENLVKLFAAMKDMDADQVKELHPDHSPETVAALLERFHVFQQGNCVVHHMFGESVANTVREEYADAYVTAHLEVPGEMFEVGLEKQLKGNGVVGSTSNILGFILGKLDDALHEGRNKALKFILGTEAGMITPIVRQVQARLDDADSELAVEIIFPVAAEAVATTEDAGLPIVPGVAAGEGCTTAGGCATCPYMKMNSLDALLHVCDSLGKDDLAAYEPKKYQERIDGRTAADLGGEPILHMRHFQTQGELSEKLVDDIQSRFS